MISINMKFDVTACHFSLKSIFNELPAEIPPYFWRNKFDYFVESSAD